jgi:protein-L-isoaspartate(D-aspartate) O-methyltransferase
MRAKVLHISIGRSNFARPGSPDPGQKRGFGNPLGAFLDLLSIGLILFVVVACRSPVAPMATTATTAPGTDTTPAVVSTATQTAAAPTLTSTATQAAATPTAEDPFATARERLVKSTIVDRGVTDPAVVEAMRAVPRHRFVPDEYLDQAYADHPLPIGYGQTISQPYIVALMTQMLELEPGDRVLEIGTGSGYQAAVLAVIVDEVYTIEIVPELAESAAARLAALGYGNAVAAQGDGYFGWAEYAPFDAIIVTAAPDHLPQPLVAQLKEGGHIVIPIGPPGGFQSLWRFTRTDDELKAENLGGVRFVPLTGPGIEGAQP